MKMKGKALIGVYFFCCFLSFSQESSVSSFYRFEGFHSSPKGEKTFLEMHLMVLIDSTVIGVGSPVNAKNSNRSLLGRMNEFGTFDLVEKDQRDSVTGFFFGKLLRGNTAVAGHWTNKGKTVIHLLELYALSSPVSFSDYQRIYSSLPLHRYLGVECLDKKQVFAVHLSSKKERKAILSPRLFPNLLSVKITDVVLKDLPQEWGQYGNLQEVVLEHCQLKNISSVIGEMRCLVILDLTGNQLQDIPVELGELSHLLFLGLADNRLTTLPEEIKELNSLQELHLEGNCFTEMEKEKIRSWLPACHLFF
jgi:hypothetical protein